MKTTPPPTWNLISHRLALNPSQHGIARTQHPDSGSNSRSNIQASPPCSHHNNFLQNAFFERLFAVLIFGLLVFQAPALFGQATGNLILNPGFEDATAWGLASNASRVTSNANSGSYSLQLIGNGSWSNTCQGSINVTPNANYTITFWAKAGAAHTVKVLNTGWGSIASMTTTANNAWTQYALPFNSGGNIQVMIDIADSATGTSYFDDFRMGANGGPMSVGANFWNIGWEGWQDYFASGVNWATTTNPWNPTLISELTTAKYKCLRFMDWGMTNNSNVSTWSQRIPATANHYNSGNTCPLMTSNYPNPGWSNTGATGYGVAYEWQIDICNRIGADLWVNVPAHADENFSYQLATLIKNKLNSNLKVYVEWSNEAWNDSFEQTSWLDNNPKCPGVPSPLTWNGRTVWSFGTSGNTRWTNYVYYACRTFNQFNQVFGTNSPRVVKVLAGELAWVNGSFNGICDWHMAVLSNSTTKAIVNPWNVTIDAYAVAPY
ncbi:MAG: carbohydrate binding domain-containing protein, partial [Verrucomicrobiota bacterium]